MAHHVFDTTQQAPFEIGASVFALLAYPTDDAADRRRRIMLALGKEHLGRLIEANPHSRSEIIRRYPEYFTSRARYTFNSLNQRLIESQQLGTLVLPFVKQAAIGGSISLPDGVQRDSWSEMSRFLVTIKRGETDISYEERLHAFNRRVKRERFPIAHLAAAFALAARVMPAASPGLHLDNLDGFRILIQTAQRFGPMIQASSPLARQATKLATLEWIEPDAPPAVFCP